MDVSSYSPSRSGGAEWAGTFLILPVSRGDATGYPSLRAVGLDGDGLAGAEEPLPSGGDTGAETWGR